MSETNCKCFHCVKRIAALKYEWFKNLLSNIQNDPQKLNYYTF